MGKLSRAKNQISDQAAEHLVNGILESQKVFTVGAGRSGLMGKSFIMRLMHMGLDAYAVGETVTSTFEKDDILFRLWRN